MSHIIHFEPIGLDIPCIEGNTIFEAARKVGIPIVSYCGGQTSCGRCKVRIIDGNVSQINKNERNLLSEEEITSNYRLACAMRVFSDIKVEIPPISLAAIQRLGLLGKEPDIALDPIITKYDLKLQEPSLENPLAAWENIQNSLSNKYGLKNLHPDISFLQNLASNMGKLNQDVSIIVRNDEVIGINEPDQDLYGIAIDIGTTKLAIYLVDLQSGKNMIIKGAMNPQILFGEDIMSRITYAIENGNEQLRKSLLEILNKIIQECTDNLENIVDVCIVGNTAMHHLFIGLPVKQLGRAPYIPAIRHSLDVKARDLGLNVANGGYIHFLPNIAGFVGADHVAMLLASELYKTKKNVIGVDIGTNTEVALSMSGNITTLSCASGPAFEGARIKNGMRASKGAIEKVTIKNDKVELGVIGDVDPVGICGSGIIDTVSQLRQNKIIDSRGRLQIHDLVRQCQNIKEFLLISKDSSGIDQDIVFTQHDISEIQLAKAAIRTGINILLYECDISEREIDEVIVAGAFGTYINVESAIKIGMFPFIPIKKFKQVGNAAGTGAKLVLISKEQRSITELIANRAKYVELTIHPKFHHEFSHSLQIP
ncbi:MAG: ASKHA domain-containing protein [Candidatus Thorarchaeota archaeon]